MFTGLLDDLTKYAGGSRSNVGPPRDTSRRLRYAGVRSEHDDLVSALSAARLKAILDDAAEGDCAGQAKLIGDMIEKDTILGAHFETRKAAITACDMRLIEPGSQVFQQSKDPRYIELWEMLVDSGLYDLCDHLLDATPRGYAGAVQKWTDGGKSIESWELVHPTNFAFDLGGNPALIIPDVADPVALTRWHPNQFVMHYYRSQPNIPARTGLGRLLAWMSFFKHEATKSWVRFLEKFGIPYLVSRISEADFSNETLKKKLVAELRDFARDGAILTTQEGGVETVTVAGHHNRIHEEFVQMVDRCYAIAILGQVGSSQGEAGRLGNNEQQEDVRQDKKKSDAIRLIRTINQQVIRPLWLYRYGSLDKCPVFVIHYSRAKDLKDKAETYKTLGDAGYHVRSEQVAYEFNVELDPALETPAEPKTASNSSGASK